VLGWCKVYPTTTTGRCHEVRRASSGPLDGTDPTGKDRGLPPFPLIRTRSGAAVAAGLLALSLSVAGCSGSDSSSAAAPPSSSSPGGGARPVVTHVTVGHVAGTVHRKYRKTFVKHKRELRHHVGRVVDAWIDGGFVGVDYPRDSFKRAFRTFTRTARHDARRQQRLMTNWPLRHDITGVHTKRRVVTIDVLAPHGHPAGVTAHVVLVFKTAGKVTKRETVKGRLFLARDAHRRWRIFGYDMSKGARS
jgi:hypothetical protein